MRITDYILPTVLSAVLYIASFVLFADIAINGVLATPEKTFIALAIMGVSLIAATATMAVVAFDARDAREFARLNA